MFSSQLALRSDHYVAISASLAYYKIQITIHFWIFESFSWTSFRDRVKSSLPKILSRYICKINCFLSATKKSEIRNQKSEIISDFRLRQIRQFLWKKQFFVISFIINIIIIKEATPLFNSVTFNVDT
jgi:hypothetical protein